MLYNHGSLLNDYYFELERNLESLYENLRVAIKWQLNAQGRDLDADGNDCYERYPFLRFKKNIHHGCMYHEAELDIPPVFHQGRYIPGKYAHLTDD